VEKSSRLSQTTAIRFSAISSIGSQCEDGHNNCQLGFALGADAMEDETSQQEQPAIFTISAVSGCCGATFVADVKMFCTYLFTFLCYSLSSLLFNYKLLRTQTHALINDNK
jgi:hypothetical protein